MATAQDRPKTNSATDNDDLGKMTIHDLPKDGKYVTRNEYTEDQQQEIAEMLRMAARTAVRPLRPELAELYDVEPVNSSNGS